MTELSLDELVASAGQSAPRLRTILMETALNVLESRLVVRTDVWHRVSESDAFAMQYFTDLLGEPPQGSWDDEVILDGRAIETLRRVNTRAHYYGSSRGAARYKQVVAEAQGGVFCSMCGRTHNLVVDHIDPVSVGGPDTVNNMQLLCVECNSGKSDLRDRALSIAIRQRLAPTVPAGLRFKHLLIDGVCINGRERGVCGCGTPANVAELRVEVWPTQAAANLLNLRTRCRHCE